MAARAVGPGDVDVQDLRARAVGACTRRVAISPNAMPATVASITIGNTLLVPVLSASMGVSPSPGAAARIVPSPPSSATAAEHRWAIIRAYSVVSVADPVGCGRVRKSISGSRTRVDGGPARSRRTSRSTPAAIPKVSVDNRTRSTPSAPTARMIRNTIDVFSVFGKTDACATTRRISLPDIGFGIIPTALPGTTGVGCSATVFLLHVIGRSARTVGSLQRVCDADHKCQALQGVACKLAVVTSGPSVVGRRTASRLHPAVPFQSRRS
jgi:hypothetical protein